MILRSSVCTRVSVRACVRVCMDIEKGSRERAEGLEATGGYGENADK